MDSINVFNITYALYGQAIWSLKRKNEQTKN